MLLVLVVEIDPIVVSGVAGRCQRRYRGCRSGFAEGGVGARRAIGQRRQQRLQMRRQVRLVQQDQAVGSGHGGIDHAQALVRPVAAKQQSRAVHGERAQQDGRSRWIGRRPRGEAAAQPDHFEGRPTGRGRQRTEALGDARDDLPILPHDVLRIGVGERTGDPLGMLGRGVHQQAPVDHPPDADRRRALRRGPVRLRCQPPHRDVQTGGLAQARRNADLRGPLFGRGDLFGQPPLPGKGVASLARHRI